MYFSRLLLSGALIGSICFTQTGCVTLFGAGNQKVAVSTKNSKVDIYQESRKVGQGTATIEAPKNQKAIEITLKGDSTLKERRGVLMLEKKSGLYNANIPLWFLAIVPGYWAHSMDRNCPKGWLYPMALDVPEPSRKPSRKPSQQFIQLDEVKSLVKDGDLMTETYRLKNGERKPCGAPGIIPTRYNTDITYDNDYFEHDLYETLKAYDFVDTLKRSIFWNKGLVLKATLKKRTFEGIIPIFDVPDALRFGPKPGWNTTAIQYTAYGHTTTTPVHEKIALIAKTVIQWDLYDAYYETKVFSDSTVSKSDPILLRTMDFTARTDIKRMFETYETATQDAMAYALVQLQDNPKFQRIMDSELADKEAKELYAKQEVIKLKKSASALAAAKPRLTDYLKSGVTIKLKEGHGSGFFISTDGYIVTNYHVVADQENDIEVILSDDSKIKANVVRTNRLTDLALLKADVSDQSILALNPDNAEVGIEVWAIGTPKSIELGQTLSRGIISGVRKIEGRSFLQTDIALNPGNSGGAVISADGTVQGVVMGGFEQSEGLNFAIPSRLVLESLKLQYEPNAPAVLPPSAKNTAPAPISPAGGAKVPGQIQTTKAKKQASRP